MIGLPSIYRRVKQISSLLWWGVGVYSLMRENVALCSEDSPARDLAKVLMDKWSFALCLRNYVFEYLVNYVRHICLTLQRGKEGGASLEGW